MILQSYEFAVESAEGLVYDGTADFGFFPARAMRDQVGIRDAAVYRMSAEECSQARIAGHFPIARPFPIHSGGWSTRSTRCSRTAARTDWV